jgi:hypothetical protein
MQRSQLNDTVGTGNVAGGGPVATVLARSKLTRAQETPIGLPEGRSMFRLFNRPLNPKPQPQPPPRAS